MFLTVIIILALIPPALTVWAFHVSVYGVTDRKVHHLIGFTTAALLATGMTVYVAIHTEREKAEGQKEQAVLREQLAHSNAQNDELLKRVRDMEEFIGFDEAGRTIVQCGKPLMDFPVVAQESGKQYRVLRYKVIDLYFTPEGRFVYGFRHEHKIEEAETMRVFRCFSKVKTQVAFVAPSPEISKPQKDSSAGGVICVGLVLLVLCYIFFSKKKN